MKFDCRYNFVLDIKEEKINLDTVNNNSILYDFKGFIIYFINCILLLIFNKLFLLSKLWIFRITNNENVYKKFI